MVPDDDRVLFVQLRGSLKNQPALLVTDCKSLYDAIQKEGAAPSSTDNRLAIDLASVKSRATEGKADLRGTDARYQKEDYLTKHASRKSEGCSAASDQ